MSNSYPSWRGASQSIFLQLSCLACVYVLAFPADLLNLWQGGRARGLTAGKSAPLTALALLPPTLSPSHCPTRSAYWRLIKEAALHCEQLGSCDLTRQAVCWGFFLCEPNSKTHQNRTRMRATNTIRRGDWGKWGEKRHHKKELSERTDTLASIGKPEEGNSVAVLSLAFHGLTS